MRPHNSAATAAVKPTNYNDFFHKIGFRVRRPLTEAEFAYLAANSQSLEDHLGFPIRGYCIWRYTLVLPNLRALKMLVRLHVLLNCLEITRDYIVRLDWLPLLRELFDQHFVQPWHGKRKTLVYDGTTTYTGQRHKGKPGHHFTWYDDEPAKQTGELDCFHIEGRYWGAQTIRRRLSIHDASDLLTFDFETYWDNNLRLVDIDRERLGRHVRNQLEGSRRRTPRITFGGLYNSDYALGCLLYHHFSLSDDQSPDHCEPLIRSLQDFIDHFGGGPFLVRIPNPLFISD